MRTILIITAVTFGAAALAGCNAPTTSANSPADQPTGVTETTSVPTSSATTANTTTAAVDTGPTWNMDESKDEMTGAKLVFARLDSDEKFGNGFGGRQATDLTLRKRNGVLNVVITNPSLQILCDEYHRPLLVKFDDQKPRSFSCVESSDHKFGVGFIESEHRFVAGLSHAKRLTIRAEIFDHGPEDMHWTLPKEFPSQFAATPAKRKKAKPEAEEASE